MSSRGPVNAVRRIAAPVVAGADSVDDKSTAPRSSSPANLGRDVGAAVDARRPRRPAHHHTSHTPPHPKPWETPRPESPRDRVRLTSRREAQALAREDPPTASCRFSDAKTAQLIKRALQVPSSSSSGKPKRTSRSATSKETTDETRSGNVKVLNMLKHFRGQEGVYEVGWRTYEAVMFHLAESGRTDHVAAVAALAQQDGIPQSMMLRAAVMEAALRGGHHAQVETLFHEAVQACPKGHAPPLSVHRILQRSYAKLGDEEKAFQLFSEVWARFDRRDLLYSGSPYYLLLLASCRRCSTMLGYLEKLLDVYAVPMSQRLLDEVMEFASRRRDVTLMQQLMQGIIRQRIVAALRANPPPSGDPRDPRKARQSQKQRGLNPVATFNSYLKVFLPGGQGGGGAADRHRPSVAEDVLSVKADMDSLGVPPNAVTYCVIFSAIFSDTSVWDAGAESGALREKSLSAVRAMMHDEVLANPRLRENTRVWGKVAELYGKAGRTGDLNEHLSLWKQRGPRLTRGSLEVVRSAFALCGDSAKAEETGRLLQQRDEFYKQRREEGGDGFPVASELPLLTPKVDALDGGGLEEGVPAISSSHDGGVFEPQVAFEQKDASIAISGLQASTTEAQLLRLLRGCGRPTFLQVVHYAPESLARAHVRYGSDAEMQRLVGLSGLMFNKRRLFIRPDRSPRWGAMTEHQAARLSLDAGSREAILRGAEVTPLSESVFKFRPHCAATRGLPTVVSRKMRR